MAYQRLTRIRRPGVLMTIYLLPLALLHMLALVWWAIQKKEKT